MLRTSAWSPGIFISVYLILSRTDWANSSVTSIKPDFNVNELFKSSKDFLIALLKSLLWLTLPSISAITSISTFDVSTRLLSLFIKESLITVLAT